MGRSRPSRARRCAAASRAREFSSRSMCSTPASAPAKTAGRPAQAVLSRSKGDEMIRQRIAWASLGLLLALSASAAVAAMPHVGNDDEGNSRQESLYERGSDALDEGRWERALEAFTEAARLSGDRTEGSLYWKAYAETKLGRRNEAVATIAELKRRFSKGRWTNDAAALEVEAAGRNARPESESDDELKLIAINSLVNSDPERALPLLQKILQGPQTPKMKERALFVLAQSGSAQARQMVAEIARGKSNPGLREKAIKYLG